MIQINELLELRNKIKEKKPNFIRQDYQRRKRLGRKLKWRKPKGIHSKIRHKFKGRRKMPSPGYKTPVEVRFLHSSGSKIVHVHSAQDIEKIENEGVVISKTVGMKKRLEILKKAKELNAAVLNLNADELIRKIEDFINSKKKKGIKEVKETRKEEIKVEKETKIQEQKEETVLSDEQKKESNASELRSKRTRSQVDEKKEKDKILTKKV